MPYPYVNLPGSLKHPRMDATITGRADARETVQVTVVPQVAQSPGDQSSDAAIRAFASEYGLSVRSEHGLIKLAGSVRQMELAWGVRLYRAETEDGGRFRSRVGPGEAPTAIAIPEELAPHVLAVLGLDDRQIAKPHFHIHPANIEPRVSFAPSQFGTIYNMPPGDGSGQALGFISLGGGLSLSDFQAMGGNPAKFHFVGIDGAKNAPTGNPQSADAENSLDAGMQCGICPGADITMIEGLNTDASFVNCIAFAATLKLSALSVSWGAPSSQWTQQARAAMDAMFQRCIAAGILVTAASGDGGATDGVTDGQAHTDYPAESPYVLALGGTSITATSPLGEAAWPNSGGGFSKAYPTRPTWQPPNGQGMGRMVPDAAFDADPASGARIVVGGTSQVFGGTSMSAPGFAALWGRLRGAGLTITGDVHAAIYAAASAFHDVTSGSNGAYRATSGPDPVSGLGSPDGAKLLAALGGSQPEPPAPTPNPPPTTVKTLSGVAILLTYSDGSSKTVQVSP